MNQHLKTSEPYVALPNRTRYSTRVTTTAPRNHLPSYSRSALYLFNLVPRCELTHSLPVCVVIESSVLFHCTHVTLTWQLRLLLLKSCFSVSSYLWLAHVYVAIWAQFWGTCGDVTAWQRCLDNNPLLQLMLLASADEFSRAQNCRTSLNYSWTSHADIWDTQLSPSPCLCGHNGSLGAIHPDRNCRVDKPRLTDE